MYDLYEIQEMHKNFTSEILEGRDHSEDLDTNGRIISEWILVRQGGKLWIGFIWLMIRNGDGSW
jgi:hypothetical protein